ncbi:cell cycle control protein 50C-like isoform X2 [Ochotona curzoniae]|nr:cell cycle control protein 50C-like isoform X2 [Ochotona curzoniae]XP_040852548.1 cell cycle control protein 50C-like isoform X2 [Ochotona curzoniae]
METPSQSKLSRLPDNTAMTQQQLPACQLYFSATMVFSIFFASGLFCLSMGILLILSAKNIQKIEINYTKTCGNCAELREDALNYDKKCTCSIPFHLAEKMQGNVYMYYKLHGFYQNLQRYSLSRSNSQLVGKDLKDVEDCAPFKMSNDGTPFAPCGAIANSMFNDTITLIYELNSAIQIQVPMLKSGITWWTDKYVKFGNPANANLSDHFAGTTKPPYWSKPIYELDPEDPENNGFLNEDFIVWMRTAAFPTFKKLYRRLNRIQHFLEGLPAGNYSFNIEYNFPVTKFQGEKSVVLSTLTWCGGSGLFLGLAYTITGTMAWLSSFVMIAIHYMLRKRRASIFYR